MNLAVLRVSVAVLALCACGRSANEPVPANKPAQANAPASVSPANVADEPAPARPAPLPEPTGPIEPKSVEAAGQVVQSYGALIEQGRWAEGWSLWSSAGVAKTFERNFRTWSDVHLEIGNPGDAEGAAGSIYVTVPAIFYGDLKSGQPARLETNVVLRRVNDVPGSTEAQRRWHIERIDLAH